MPNQKLNRATNSGAATSGTKLIEVADLRFAAEIGSALQSKISWLRAVAIEADEQ